MTQKKVKASDVIGNSYYIYNLTSSNYTPSLNGTVNVTCTVTNVYGQAVSGKSITLYLNSTSQSAKTTDSNGTATWNSITMSSAGLQVFRVEDSKIEVFVDNKSDIGHTHSGYLTSSDISGKLDKSQTSYKGKNVVVDSSTGNITFEDKNNHTHSSYLTSSDLSDYVTTDDSRLSDSRTPTSHSHGNLQNNGQVGSTAQANKNVVTNSSGLITTEDKPTIPSASSTTPSADTQSGSVGTGTTWARSNHTHPKSSLYAESSHTHTKSEVTDFPTIPSKTSDLTNDSGFLTSHQDITGKLDKAQTSYKGKNVVVDSTSGNITFEDKNNHTHSQYLTDHQSLTNYVQKSSTTGLIKNDGTIDTSSYLTSHQTLKTINNESIVGTGNISISGGGNVTIDSTWVTNSTNPVESKLVKSALDDKLDKTHSSYKGKNVVTNSSTGAIEFEEKNNHSHSEYLTSHQDISGKIDTAGTGLSKSGTTLNHSNSVTALTTASLKKMKHDAQGHITETSDVSASDLVNLVYPVGSIYMSVNSTSPATLFGGTWTRIKDTFLLASGDTYASDGDVATAQHGSADAVVVEHTHTQDSHYHNAYDEYFVANTQSSPANYRVGSASTGKWTNAFDSSGTFKHHKTTNTATATNQSTGVSGTGKNMPPYMAVYVWKRTA